MIRPLTLLTLLAAGGAGLHLYQVKHSVAVLDKELRDIHRQTEVAFERTQVLRGSWARLNEPGRLQEQADKYLTLSPMQPQQFVRANDAMAKLPQAIAFNGAPSLFAAAQDQKPSVTETGPAPVAQMASATTVPANRGRETTPPAARAAEAASAGAALASLVAPRIAHAAPAPAPVVAAAAPPARPAPSPVQVADASSRAATPKPRAEVREDSSSRLAEALARRENSRLREQEAKRDAAARELATPIREASREMPPVRAARSPLLRQETPTVVARNTPLLRQAMHVQPQQAPVPAYGGSSLGGSALGMSGGGLAPPVPYGGGAR